MYIQKIRLYIYWSAIIFCSFSNEASYNTAPSVGLCERLSVGGREISLEKVRLDVGVGGRGRCGDRGGISCGTILGVVV